MYHIFNFFSGTGKTDFALKAIKFAPTIMTSPPDRIVYCLSVTQPKLETLAKTDSRVELHDGLIDIQLLKDHDPQEYLLVIFDDLMNEENLYEHLSKTFTKYSRHNNISCMVMTQVR